MSQYFEWRLLAVLALLAGSALFAAAESAFFSVFGSGALTGMEDDSAGAAIRIREMLTHPSRLISSILVGNEIVNVLISVLIASVFASVFLNTGAHNFQGKDSVWISVLSIAVSAGLILVVGEVIPKTLGVRFHRKLSALIAEPFFWYYKIIYPVQFIFQKTSQGLLALVGIRPGKPKKLKDPELAELVDVGGEEGILQETEYALLKNVFAFGDLTVIEVMTPRQDIFSLPAYLDYGEFKRKFLESRFSRIPVYRAAPDQIMGTITAKDLLKLDASPAPKSVAAALRRPFCVPPRKRLDDLLIDFLNRRIHMALVVNEYGEVMGLVTIEDLLAEIFGESRDDEQAQDDLVEVGENRWELSGGMEIRAFNEKMETDLNSPGIKTMAGFLLNEFGRVPQVGDEISRQGFDFRVKEIRRRQVQKIEVEKNKDG
jgi:putative hemolysin